MGGAIPLKVLKPLIPLEFKKINCLYQIWVLELFCWLLKMHASSWLTVIHGLKLAIWEPQLSTLRSYLEGCVIVMEILFEQKILSSVLKLLADF